MEGKIGNLSKGVFERRTSTGSEDFSLLICLENLGRTTAQEFKKSIFDLRAPLKNAFVYLSSPLKALQFYGCLFIFVNNANYTSLFAKKLEKFS